VSGFKFLCASDQLIEGEFTELDAELDGRRAFLVATRYQGRPRVWMNVCPHQGRPLNWAPNQFLKDDAGRLVCAAHGAVFELEEGRCVSGPCRNAGLTALDVEEKDAGIHVRRAS
jgi:nitrite reductase/ring-hydroxylating ferredoxin subunit